MSKVETMLYGIYPRDEQLRIAISKWERGATTTSELSGIINKEKHNLLSVFRQSGLDHYTDPLVNWHDILRMISYTISSKQLEKLGRYRETNTFYKQPEIDDYPVYHDLSEQDSDPDKFLPGEIYSNDNSDSYLHFLPGPESFLNMSIVKKELKREKILESLITVYKEIMKKIG
jgi:Methionine synthase II (cobalamin-independent)